MITIKTAAKINLFLDVLGKRHDGYHNIKSLLLPISLFDTVRLEERPGDITTVIPNKCHFKGIPWSFSMGEAADNLITSAAKLFKKATGCKKGARISLIKRIPIGAGLGGGSSDAAAVLTGLNRLWRIGLTKKELMEMGARIGCDVPALIHGGGIRMEQRGEVISSISKSIKRDFYLLLVYPGFGISTGDIYQRHDRNRTSGISRALSRIKFQSVMRGLERGSLTMVGAGLFNALQETVFRKYPLLEIIKNNLEKAGAEHVLLTGSGSTVFVVLKTRHEGAKLAHLIRKAMGSPLWAQVVQTIGKQD